MTFVSMIARRRLIDLNRKRQTASRVMPAESVDSVDLASMNDPARNAELSDDAAEAIRFLDDLPGAQKEAIRLSIYSGLTHLQIAERMNLPLGTIKTHIRRGLVKVREQLKQTIVMNQGGAV